MVKFIYAYEKDKKNILSDKGTVGISQCNLRLIVGLVPESFM